MMKKKTSPPHDTSRPPAAGSDLPTELSLGPEEASDAVREARRLLGKPPLPEAEPALPKDTEPEPPIPWGPLRPDEVPS
jgi:hypothetical protein